MSTSKPARPDAPAETAVFTQRRLAVALAVIVSCEFMIMLDATIVNVALPSIQASLNFSGTGLSWVVNAFLLAFGGLLLLGGRAADILGRRRVFVGGTALFGLASLLGGFATTGGGFVAARAAQGVGAALAGPSGLALLITHFDEGPARNRAFALYSNVSGSGLAVGLVLGGVLSTALSWRWVMFINVPVAALVLLLAPRVLTESERQPGRFDLAGALTSTGGLVSLVYGLIRVSEHGWRGVTVGTMAAGVVLLGLFVATEARTVQPLLPLRLLAERNRMGGYLTLLLVASVMTSMWFFLTQFMQRVLGFDPLTTGLAFLPLAAAIFLATQTVPSLLARVGAKPLAVAGMAAVTAAAFWLSQLSVTSTYVSALLGPLLLFGIGVGYTIAPLNVIVLSGVAARDSGAASGFLQAMMTTGGALGLAVLITVFGAASRNAGETALLSLAASTARAFGAGTVFAGCAFVVALISLKRSAKHAASENESTGENTR